MTDRQACNALPNSLTPTTRLSARLITNGGVRGSSARCRDRQRHNALPGARQAEGGTTPASCLLVTGEVVSVCDQQLVCRDLDDKAPSQTASLSSAADANSELMPRRSRSGPPSQAHTAAQSFPHAQVVVRSCPGVLYLRSKNLSMTALSPQGETVSEVVGLLISEAGSQTWGRWGVFREGSEATVAAHCYSPSTALSVTEEAGEGGRADGMGRVSLLGAT